MHTSTYDDHVDDDNSENAYGCEGAKNIYFFGIFVSWQGEMGAH